MYILFIILALFSCNFIEATNPKNNEINVIYQTAAKSEGFYEYDWLKEVLSGITYNEHFDGKYQTVLKNTIIVVSKPPLATLQGYLGRFLKKGYSFGIIHLSDELYDDQTNHYRNAKFVFRNYWHKKFANQKNVHFFPLGYKRGFWDNYRQKKLAKSTDRSYSWSFIGQANKSTRIEMINQMKKVPNYFFYETFAFFDTNAMSAQDYRDVLLDSIFVPCPRGSWNLDSFRVCEALECGCIPIVEKTPLDYFANFYQSYPFLAVNNWEEAPDMVNELLADPNRLEKHRSDCTVWWKKQKERLKNKVRNVVNNNF